MKKILIQLAVLIALIMPFMAFSSLCVNEAKAQTQIPEMQDVLRQAGSQTGLPGFEKEPAHSEAGTEPGTTEITSTILYLVDYIKYFVGGIAVIIIIYAGANLIIGGKEEKKAEESKRILIYGIVALIIVIVADVFVRKVFFGEAGEAFKTEGSAQFFGKEGALMIRGIYNFAQIFVASIAILMIIINGVRIAMSFGDEDARKKGITRILYSLAGLVVVGISEFVVKGVIFPEHGEKIPAADKAIMIIKGLTNFASALVATAAFVMLIFAGYSYIAAGANPDSAQKAKKMLFASIIGLILAAGAFALVNTFIKLK